MALIINSKKCIGCGICVQACPVDALEIVDGIVKVDQEKCIKCGKCVRVCPTSAIELEGYIKPKDTKPKKVLTAEEANSNCSGVWVLVEQQEGEAAEVSWELIGEARKLADKLSTEVAGVLIGENVDKIIPECFAYGADTVYVVDSPVLKDYRTEPYSQALSKLIREYAPEIVLMGATTLGRDLAGHTATLVNTGLTADCTQLSIEEETRLLRQTRPAFGGNVMATIVCADHRPQMATVRPKVMEMPVKRPGRAGKVIREEAGNERRGSFYKNTGKDF
jgi:electron transfer flavoprotein alpha subunit